ncbi:MAG: YggT family protein [Acidimicrobiia bacterium]|nr:YggT family protein [Acidimicrobiia bacterium]
MTELLCWALRIYLVILVARAVLSWFPPNGSGGALITVNRLLLDLTEPVLAPLRRMIPAVGMFDLSFMVAVFGLMLLQQAICPG